MNYTTLFSDPIAYFYTWATYGTWLPGDDRGWTEFKHGFQLPNAWKELESLAKMSEDACILQPDEREQVHEQLQETCNYKKWHLHAVNCRSNHFHAVISAPLHPKTMRSQIKAWLTRRLKAYRQSLALPARDNWWAERGSIRWIFTEEGLETAILYVRDGQDGGRYR
jgi:REP element-mobilizing transposase RayT